MSLNDEERKTVVELELEKADQTFEEIEILANAGRWSGAANRLYYAVFHAVNALLISDGHQGWATDESRKSGGSIAAP